MDRLRPRAPMSYRDPLMDALAAGMTNRPDSVKAKPGRNDPCPCGSGRKHKRCCLNQPLTGGQSEGER